MVKVLISFVDDTPSEESGTYKRLFEASFMETDPGDNAVYAMGDIIISTTEGECRLRHQFKKYSFGPGNSVTVEDIKSIDSIPLEVLRALSAQRKPWGNPLSGTEVLKETIALTISFPLRKIEEAPQFHFLDRRTSGKLTWKSTSYDYYGSAPLFRVLPNIIYVEEEKSFFLYGGYFPLDSSPESHLNFWLRETGNLYIGRLGNSTTMTRKKAEYLYEEYLRNLEKSFVPLPDLWKYNIEKDAWKRIHICGGEGADPSRYSNLLQYADTVLPTVAGGILHIVRKKIYFYVDIFRTRNWDIKEGFSTCLKEFDYRTEKTSYCADIGGVSEHFLRFPVIDYSNNTLIVFLHKGKDVYFIVVCFETYKRN